MNYSKKSILLTIVFAAVLVGIGVWTVLYRAAPAPVIQACPMDAKICPDGSAVGRTGPNCEFAACPSVASSTGQLTGKVSIGPICPVERVGVPCPVPPEAYTSRSVVVYAKDGVIVVASSSFNPDGTYLFSLAPGEYVVNIPRSGVGGNKDLPKTITITANMTTTLDFSIDTGIR